MIFGLDLLGLAKYPKVAAKEFPAGFALGCFSNTFGDARPAVEAILKTGKCPAVRVHLMWKDLHNFTTKDFPVIVKEAKKWAGIVKKYPDIKWYFSGACENHLSAGDAVKLANQVTKILPSVTYVNSGDAKLKDLFLNEVHGAKAKALKTPYIFSFDGSACVDCDVEAIKNMHKDAEIFFLWDAPFNQRLETNDTTPRKDRTYKPSAKLIRSIVELVNQTGASKLPKGWLYKSHAETSKNKVTGKIDAKSDKAMFISPIALPEMEGSQIKLKIGAKTVATFNYYGPYKDGGWRYYAAKFGYEIAKQSVDVWLDEEKYGFVTPAFRAGNFKD